MKCAVIFADGLKQIMFSPESDNEKFALSLIGPDEDIAVDIKQGVTLYDNVPPSAFGYVVAQSQGGYLRAYEQKGAVMLVLRPKKEKK